MALPRLSGAARLRGHRIPTLVGALAAVAAIAISGLSFNNPPLVVLAIAVPFVSLFLRGLPIIALVLLTAGPLLFSGYTVGTLTLDNYVTIAGLGCAVIWAVQAKRVSSPLLSVFPLLIAVAIALSATFAGINSTPGIIRFVGLAFVPALIIGGAVTRVVAERAIFLALLVGALSVITQPVLPLVPPYVDPQTGAERYGGLMGHPNFAAYAIGVGLVFLLSGRNLRFARWALVGVFAVAILMTGSVGALATVVVGSMIVMLNSSVVRTIFVAFAGLIGAVALGGTVGDRITALVSGNQNLNSVNWRFEQWQAAFDLVGQNWATGIGWQQVPLHIADGLEAHSAYVEIIVELGIVGMALAAVGMAFLVRAAGAHIVPLTLLLVVFVSSITDPVMVYPSSLATLLTLLACSRVALGEKARARSVVVKEPVLAGHRALPPATAGASVATAVHRSGEVPPRVGVGSPQVPKRTPTRSLHGAEF